MSFKSDFPLFQHNPGLVYLDSAATLQKPSLVIDGVKEYLENDYANIHRGRYSISERSEEMFWQCRKKTTELINAYDESEIVFTSNTTDAVNKLVQSLCVSGMLGKGDTVMLSRAEHHANIVPRQMGAKRYGYEVVFFSLDEQGNIDTSERDKKPDSRVKLVSLTMVSNVLGEVFDIVEIKKQIESSLSSQDTVPWFAIDASQAVPHILVDVQTLGVDFLFFTGHKIGALTGIGVLRGKQELLKQMMPSFGGGGVIEEVTERGYRLQGIPDKFEPGTPNLVGALSMKLALEYMENQAPSGKLQAESRKITGFYDVLDELEMPLLVYCFEQFTALEEYGVSLLGTKDMEKKIGLFSFTLPLGKFPIQLGQYMAEKNICIRCGGQCAHILHKTWTQAQSQKSKAQNILQTCRLSLWGYNEMRDVEIFFEILKEFLGV